MSRKVVIKSLIALCALNLSLLTGFSQNILQNGSFEEPGFEGDSGQRLPAQESAPIDSWTTSAINVRWLKGDEVFDWTPNRDHGDYFINLDGYLHNGGTVAQTFSTIAGNSYRVTFDINADYGAIAENILQIEVAGSTNVFSHTIQSNWQEQSFAFVANAANANLLFRNIDNTGSRSPYIDNVRVEELPPPRPFVNGSFEEPGFAGETGEVLPAQQGAEITGWTPSAFNVRWLKGDGVHNFTPNRDNGDYFINLDGHFPNSGTIAQTFDTLAGTTYRVTFNINADFGAIASDILQVEIAGTTNAFSHTVQSNWQEQSFDFAATDSAATLLFRNIDTSGSQSPFIDNVRIELAPPPDSDPDGFVNGSFELPGFDGQTGEVLPAQQGIEITGWVTSEQNVRWLKGDGVYNFTPNRDHGDYFINLDGYFHNGGTIEQTFDTVPGAIYRVMFDMNADFGAVVTNALQAEVVGRNFIFSHFLQDIWQEWSFEFVANDTNATLLFRNIDNSGSRSPYIDNVRVENLGQGGLVFNGNFAMPGGTNGTLSDGTAGVVVDAGSQFITGWRTSAGQVGYNGPDRFNRAPGDSDGYSVELGANWTPSAIEQAITTASGHNYVASFFIASYPNFGAGTISVSANGNSTNFSVPANSGTNLTWERKEFRFTAGSSGETLLKFQNVLNGLSAVELDNVTVVSALQEHEAVPPVIIQHPQGTMVDPGGAVTLNVEATGTWPLSYQWYKGTEALALQTDQTLVFNSVTEADEGTYYVIISNAVGIAVSSNASITVNNQISSNLLVNGSFASPGGTNGTLGDGTQGIALQSGSTFITGWVTSNGVVGYNGPNRFSPAPGDEDGYSVEVGANWTSSAIVQTVPTVAGREYILTFQAASYPGFGAGTVEVRAGEVLQRYSTERNTTTNLAWEAKELRFIAGLGDETRLVFQNVLNGLSAVELDSISLASSTPDPDPDPEPAQPFRNGNFAEPGGPGGELSDGTRGIVLPSGSTHITGWLTSDGMVGYNGPHRWSPAPGDNDGYSVQLGANWTSSAIEQTFTTVPGQEYIVAFAAASYPWFNSAQLRAIVGENETNFFLPPNSTTNLDWQVLSLRFVADSSGQTTLKFKNILQGLSALELDTVVVTPVTAGPFQNGNFAQPGGSGGTLSDGTRGIVLPEGGTQITGWVTDDGLVGYNGPHRWSPAPGDTDGYSVELGANWTPSAIEQTFLTSPGQTYGVIFYMASYPNFGAGTVEVSAGDSVESFDATVNTSTNLNWEQKVFRFTADFTGHTTLRFQNVLNGLSAIELDSISLQLAPRITRQPIRSIAVPEGGTVHLAVEAVGEDLSYQWYYNGNAIPGATSPTLTFNAVSVDEGNYHVVVSNTAGEATSSTAFVRVFGTPITITRHPASQTVVEGRTVSLSVGVTGSAPITYQWFRNDSALPEATNNFLSFTASPSTAGSYKVAVSNNEGSVLSETAEVTLLPDPFPGRAGRYIGLFAEDTAQPGTSGLIELQLESNGEYNMSVRIGTLSNSITHFFDSNGVTRIAAGGRVPVEIDLDLEASGFQELKGVVTGSNWTAQLQLDKTASDGTAEVDANLQGVYTFALQGHADEAVMPGGHSIGRVTVYSNGVAQISGTLADGTKLSTTSKLTIESGVPVYSPLYGKAGGTLIGWLMINTNNGSADLQGELDWVKPPVTNGLYQAGFRFRTPAVGAKYVAPVSGRALNVTNGMWLVEGGYLNGGTGDSFKWTAFNAIRFVTHTNRVSVKITPSKGNFQGSFVHPQLGTTNKFSGVLIQGSHQFGLGYFVDGDRAGAVYIGE